MWSRWVQGLMKMKMSSSPARCQKSLCGSRSHRQELDELRRSDPDFYKFLQDTDAELLQFEDDEGAEAGASSESNEKEEEEGPGEVTRAAGVCRPVRLTQAWYQTCLHLQWTTTCPLPLHAEASVRRIACGGVCRTSVMGRSVVSSMGLPF